MNLPDFVLSPLQHIDAPAQRSAKVGLKQKTEGAGKGKDGVNFSFNAPPAMDPFTHAKLAVLGMPDPKVKR